MPAPVFDDHIRDLAIVVLAGGEGRRMGGGKPLRAFGGTSLIAHAVHLARRWSGPVAIAVRDAAQLPDAPAPVILDAEGVDGPAAGLQAALAFGVAQRAGAVLTIPCDTPHLPIDLAPRLKAALTPAFGCSLAVSGGQAHPTCGLWRTGAAGRLDDYLAGGRRSLRGFAAELGAAFVEWPLVDGADPFANANTPEELAALQPRG
ncbi:molybdenum cofactor guanylyltransferase [Phenylobacterium sp. J426]|uniref:molybdenum cofactor guanylyltransferase n=1 Tax=Phenylobacterium sp. J426 TaxID=2898439 RepID=UPI002150E12C|nr:molybdenum cofactor guanylyltransferase [Phenylobacterium sp. J426]MCR5872779.1 molybdenum cofactor guanylyltransferase [Phenylobacterium sp. J426]